MPCRRLSSALGGAAGSSAATTQRRISERIPSRSPMPAWFDVDRLRMKTQSQSPHRNVVGMNAWHSGNLACADIYR